MGDGDVPVRVIPHAPAAAVALPAPAAPLAPVAPTPPAAASRVQRLSVVIPARNEALNLDRLLDEVGEVLAQLQLPFAEVVVVDDGSTDETPAIAARHGARVVRHPVGLGNGAAVKRGLREARGDWIVMLDGDGQHPPADLPAMIAMAESYDMVVASRGGRGGSLHRNFANQVYNRFASYVSGRQIPDLTSGYRLLRADVAKSLVWLLPNTFSYPTTITMSMLRGGWAVGFHPFQVRQRKGKSHVRLFADGSRFFVIILRIATMFAPLRVFLPTSLVTGAIGFAWYLHTWLTEGRFTNMALLLLTQAMLMFALGLIAEQIAALRFQGLSQVDTQRAPRDDGPRADAAS
ncbi:MAG: glycosyltransferase family 2 protein [Planctomycetes bacterium]|nr:glycosyltransferase family 2 protein [Planctomycetota bacterium]